MKLFIILSLVALATIASAESECQKQRAKEAKNTSPLKLDVKCLENGDYAPLQCFPNNKFCYCALPDGTQVTQPSKAKKSCGCDVEKYAVDKKLQVNGRPIDPPSGSYVPKCERDGKYSSKQCETGTDVCWCVNPEQGTQISKDKKKGITC